MIIKLYAAMSIFLIFGIANKVNAQILVSHCSHEFFAASGYNKNVTGTYYTCYLSSEISEFEEEIIGIDIQHEEGFTDDNVEWLINYEKHRFKVFSTFFCNKFPNLKLISLNGMELKSIDVDSLSNCKNLEYINLGTNRVAELPENLLAKNLNLRQFWLESNQLTTIPENFFLNNTEIDSITFNENRLNYLPSSIFQSLVKMEVLYLNKNKLEFIDPKWFENTTNLKWLDLQNNLFLEIPSKAFQSLKNLEILWLNDNRIIFLNSDSFEGLENVKSLSLQTNEILDLPREIFAPLTSLNDVDLSNNNLSIIYSDSFAIDSNLSSIWLDNNKIIAIDEKISENSSISSLDLSNNICSQSLVTSKTEIKLHLQKCFDNFSPRPIETIVCGKPIMAKGNVIGGSQIVQGSYPWITALFSVFKGKLGSFFCGGTIISSRKIVTAAHCIQKKYNNRTMLKREIRVVLGSHDLDKRTEVGRVGHDIQKIHIHPSWNVSSERYDADIAVLVLKDEIEFGSSIQPICMMESNSIMAKMTKGVVVGYGKSEDDTKEHENIPKMLEIPFYDNEICFLANNVLALYSSSRTFCGGSGNGTGVCKGDSGSGVFVDHNGRNYLRGVVSNSLYSEKFTCDINTYAIFTDVLKFTDWIKEIPTDDLDCEDIDDRPVWDY